MHRGGQVRRSHRQRACDVVAHDFDVHHFWDVVKTSKVVFFVVGVVTTGRLPVEPEHSLLGHDHVASLQFLAGVVEIVCN